MKKVPTRHIKHDEATCQHEFYVSWIDDDAKRSEAESLELVLAESRCPKCFGPLTAQNTTVTG